MPKWWSCRGLEDAYGLFPQSDMEGAILKRAVQGRVLLKKAIKRALRRFPNPDIFPSA